MCAQRGECFQRPQCRCVRIRIRCAGRFSNQHGGKALAEVLRLRDCQTSYSFSHQVRCGKANGTATGLMSDLTDMGISHLNVHPGLVPTERVFPLPLRVSLFQPSCVKRGTGTIDNQSVIQRTAIRQAVHTKKFRMRTSVSASVSISSGSV